MKLYNSFFIILFFLIYIYQRATFEWMFRFSQFFFLDTTRFDGGLVAISLWSKNSFLVCLSVLLSFWLYRFEISYKLKNRPEFWIECYSICSHSIRSINFKIVIASCIDFSQGHFKIFTISEIYDSSKWAIWTTMRLKVTRDNNKFSLPQKQSLMPNHSRKNNLGYTYQQVSFHNRKIFFLS